MSASRRAVLASTLSRRIVARMKCSSHLGPARSLAFALILCASCSSPRSIDPDIAALYHDAARVETRNPVVVIHGILGAHLKERESGRAVWGAFGGSFAHPGTPDGARAIALPLTIPASAYDYDPKTADVIASGPLGALNLSLLFRVISVEVYAGILRTLGVGGYLDPVTMDPSLPQYPETHFTCFTFFYDWRRDNVENAIHLGHYLQEKRQEIARHLARRVVLLRQEGKHLEAQKLVDWHRKGYKFDLVAHSMGGLIARYFLRYGAEDLPADGSLPKITWKGAREVDRLALVGTPSFGAAESFENLVSGFSLSFLLPHYPQEILGTMPALYQLLPRSRHHPLLDNKGKALDLDLLDPALWEAQGWGLAADNADAKLRMLLPQVAERAERRRIALRYQAWCLQRAQRFHEALDQAPEGATPTEIHLFAADSQKTKTHVRLVKKRGRFVPHFTGAFTQGYGDGTVPRYSVVADERAGDGKQPYLRSPVPWASISFISDDHIGLTTNPQFTNNLLYLLLERPSYLLPEHAPALAAPKPPALLIPQSTPARNSQMRALGPAALYGSMATRFLCCVRSRPGVACGLHHRAIGRRSPRVP